MSDKPKVRKKRGRPRSEEAHKALLEATWRLMTRMQIRQITMEQIATEAGVGRPTIYRWWSSKCGIFMDAFLENTAPQVPFPKDKPALEALTIQTRRLIKLLRGQSGNIVAQMVGEGQADPHILEEFRDRFFAKLLDPARIVIENGKESGELDKNLNTELALDLIYGPIYYRLLVGHNPLDEHFSKTLPTRIAAALISQDS